MPEHEDDLALLVRAARAAGEIARRHFRRRPEVWEKAGGQGPVTEVDLEIDRALREELTAARPDYGWLSEESVDTGERTGRDAVFIVDPIDGTRAFIAGQPDFAHSLAITRGGTVTHGVIYLPERDLLYVAERGHGARLGEQLLQVPPPRPLERAEVLAGRREIDPAHWSGAPPAFRRRFRPSLAWRLALVGEGRHDAMLTLRPAWEWDIAAGSLIAEEAGARVTDRFGLPLRFNLLAARAPGVVVAAEPLHGEILSRLRREQDAGTSDTSGTAGRAGNA